MLNKVLVSIALGIVLTAISYGAGLYFQWIDSVNWLEAFAVFTSYSCTYLCVVQSRINYIFGVISVAALSLLFYQTGLYSSMVLNLYLIPTLIWGWFRWGRDDMTRPVKFVEWQWWPVYIGLAGAVWYALITISTYMGAVQAPTDSFILAASVLAQFLLDQKKIENWGIWAIINVVAIYTYWNSGLVIVALQYVFFLMNVFWGLYDWRKSMLVERNA
jgi:nicotinamide mononucleotide transporter